MPLCFYRRVSLYPRPAPQRQQGRPEPVPIGHRGAWYTLGPHGRRRVTLGLPGTGLFWTENVPPGPPIRHHHRIALAIVVIAALVAICWLALSGGGADGRAT